MTLLTPDEYVASLRDGRVVHWAGELIPDVTTHPNFAGPLAVASRDYEYNDPDTRNVLTFETESGERANRIFQIPSTEHDLRDRFELFELLGPLAAVTGGYIALLSIADELREVNSLYADNLIEAHRRAMDGDLRAAELVTDAKGDRSRAANEQDDPDLYLRIVDRGPDGITVSGAKFHITAASLAHEFIVLPTRAMRPGEEDYAVSFVTPANAPGITIINRSTTQGAETDPFDYPFSSRYDMPEAMVVFENVHIPWDRVFLAGETRMAGYFARTLGLWERTLGLVKEADKAQILVGLAALVTEQQGKDRAADTQATLSELISYAEILRMALEHSAQNYERTPSGMIHPNLLSISVAKYHYALHYHEMVRNLQDLAGGLVMTLPVHADLLSEHTGGYLRKYLHTKPDVDIEDRMRVFNGIRDLTADSYGGWNLVTALQAGGGLNVQRITMGRSFDIKAAKAKARHALSIEPPS